MSKILILSFLLLLSQQLNFSTKQFKKSRFGALEIIDYTDEGMFKQVLLPSKSLQEDYIQQSDYLYEAIDQIKFNQEKGENLYNCSDRIYGDESSAGTFFPIFVHKLMEYENYTYYGGYCFQKITFHFDINYNDDNTPYSVTFIMEASNPRGLFCKDWFFIANTEFQSLEVMFFSGKNFIEFTNIDEVALSNIKSGGFKIFQFCSGYIDSFISVYKFIKLFMGDFDNDETGTYQVPEYMEEANIVFLNNTMNYTLVERDIQFVYLNESYINSGDYFACMRLDGIDPLIMYGTGSHAGHAAMALWIEDELYIVESTSGNYWSTDGIQKNKYKDWLKYAIKADYHVAVFPLKEEYQQKFNASAAIDFFESMEKHSYGFYNFLFGWIDTPFDNWPPLLPAYFITIAFAMIEHINEPAVDMLYKQAMNHRLQTTNLTVSQLAAKASEFNISLEEAMALPEEDWWLYLDTNYQQIHSFVCSAFVAALYKAAGVFDNLQITATEQTPKDVYTMALYDLEWERPDDCVQADPDQPFCQILGKYRMTFPYYSSVEVYDHMGEKCPTVAPEYLRPQGC